MRSAVGIPVSSGPGGCQFSNIGFAKDYSTGSMTTSGFPRIRKLWKREIALSAAETFEGVPIMSL